ncbi:MAG: hypothetical protein IKZ47_07510 [Clostridia bacterium]|nr:hypothetical protein [Clostridia bacterium]
MGKPGSGPKFKGGYGFSHIIAKHGESTAQKAIETIAKASECSIQGNDNTDATQYRLRVYFDGCTAILSKSPETNHWLLTAWDNKEETAVYATGEVRDSLGATAVTPTLNRRSGVNTTVSNHSIRQNAEESQEKVSARDSHGAELSKEQQEYFENSVVRDERLATPLSRLHAPGLCDHSPKGHNLPCGKPPFSSPFHTTEKASHTLRYNLLFGALKGSLRRCRGYTPSGFATIHRKVTICLAANRPFRVPFSDMT